MYQGEVTVTLLTYMYCLSSFPLIQKTADLMKLVCELRDLRLFLILEN
jgi:hypothetical protein